MQQQTEPMAAFFARRVEGYDRHMLENVVGCARGYEELAARLPDGTAELLDLGVGTGLELAPIYRRFPAMRVTGVDLCPEMLSACARKYAAQNPRLLCGDYAAVPLGERAFDAAVSFETLHHLTPEEKAALYARVCAALREGGTYLQGDFAARDEAEERACREAYEALRASQEAPGSQRVHFDTPLTAAHDCDILLSAGFARAQVVWQEGNTALIIAHKADTARRMPD